MNITETEIAEVKIVEPTVYEDKRGFFFESFNHKKFEEGIGRKVRFVQDNHSRSSKGVLRGLHFQSSPKAQGKLVRVIFGEVFDVAVDIRKSSPTYGKWVSEVLSENNKKQLWVPEGFAHGFLTLSPVAELLYKTTEYYAPEYDNAIRWDDKQINVGWPQGLDVVVSEKDLAAKSFNEMDLFK